MRAAMALGRLTKNGSSSFSVTRSCHVPTIAMPTASWPIRTARRSGTPAPEDFVTQHRPQIAIEIEKRRLRAQFEHVARTIERHRVARNDMARRPRREHDDFVGERDRLFEIVGDKEHGLLFRAL